MKIKLNKKALVNLSQDEKKLPQELTPNIAGGRIAPESIECPTVACTRISQGTANICL